MQSAGWDQGEFYAENEWKFIFVDMKLDHIAKEAHLAMI